MSMLKKVLFIYDDSIEPSREVKSITGGKSFGNTIFKRVTLRDRILQALSGLEFIEASFTFSQKEDIPGLIKNLQQFPKEIAVFQMCSNFTVQSMEQFSVLVEKSRFLNQNMNIFCGENLAGIIFSKTDDYIKYLKESIQEEKRPFTHKIIGEHLHSEAMVNLDYVNNFLQFITSGFDARFFNVLEGNHYTVTKKSVNKAKIKSEYEFYYLLPEEMKMWFVMPFSYKETEEYASYTMERYHTTDIAIRFVHGAIDLQEFEEILKNLFYFVLHRKKKQVSKEQYEALENKLYLNKLKERIEDLKKSEFYKSFDQAIGFGTDFKNIDEIIVKYETLFHAMKKRKKMDTTAVVGHGDLCFSNILYNKEMSLLKLIDPKGAVTEEELWTNPYYDLAKLSHSICGCYDFFNNGLYEIKIVENMKLQLDIDFDNQIFKNIFKQYLEENGFDYPLVRIYEASLFLSMLPLHMDNPQKTFGFLLNGINILKEVEACLKD